MKLSRVAAYSLITSLALADTAGAAYLWSAWQERHVLLAEQTGGAQHPQAATLKPDRERQDRSVPPL